MKCQHSDKPVLSHWERSVQIFDQPDRWEYNVHSKMEKRNDRWEKQIWHSYFDIEDNDYRNYKCDDQTIKDFRCHTCGRDSCC